jgi:hypothetical protein
MPKWYGLQGFIIIIIIIIIASTEGGPTANGYRVQCPGWPREAEGGVVGSRVLMTNHTHRQKTVLQRVSRCFEVVSIVEHQVRGPTAHGGR